MKWLALELSLPIFTLLSAHAQVPSTETRCPGGPVAVVIVEDAVHVPAWQSDALRSFQLPSLAHIGRTTAARAACLHVLDADPFFATARGREPELLLRARVSDAKSAERSLADKADTVVRRYVESYLGGGEAQTSLLQAAEVTIEVVCVRERTFLAGFAGLANRDADSTSSSATLVGVAFEGAQSALLQELASLQASCRAPAKATHVPAVGASDTNAQAPRDKPRE